MPRPKEPDVAEHSEQPVTVDEHTCVGSRECMRVAPTAFVVDEDEGLARVLDTASTTPTDHLERAARECPTGAITVART